jgi:hypothetical protein
VPPYSPTDPAVLAFYVIPAVLLGLFTWSSAAVAPPHQRVRIGRLAFLAGAAWMAIAWRAAASGVLRKWNSTPPPFFILLVAVVGIACLITWSPLGRRLAFHVPLWALVLVQLFRFPLELAMHRLATLGVMPEPMSYTGRNFDILTGATALLVAWWLGTGRGGRALALSWNVLGFLLLTNVVIVAVLATPRFQMFGADHVNVFVTYPPFVWLPTVMVLSALTGHLLIFRRLLGHDPARDSS